jgi:hypothetical protein
MPKPPGSNGKGAKIVRTGQTAVSQYGTNPSIKGTVRESPHDVNAK